MLNGVRPGKPSDSLPADLHGHRGFSFSLAHNALGEIPGRFPFVEVSMLTLHHFKESYDYCRQGCLPFRLI